jgi:hypothetical protein
MPASYIERKALNLMAQEVFRKIPSFFATTLNGAQW